MSPNVLIDGDVCTEDELSNPAFVRELPYRYLQHHLCNTCKLFGSTFFAAKVRVRDLPIDEYWIEMTEIRDGVGIDRDTETAVPKVKFDLEVVPSQTRFAFLLDAENLLELLLMTAHSPNVDEFSAIPARSTVA